uniref:Uncharacterized protein n=1 Tax=Oryza punctata TaxID=4537 RepID=A0A0E0KNA0_ORYPU
MGRPTKGLCSRQLYKEGRAPLEGITSLKIIRSIHHLADSIPKTGVGCIDSLGFTGIHEAPQHQWVFLVNCKTSTLASS